MLALLESPEIASLASPLPEAPTHAPYRTPLFGREHELAELDRRLRTAIQGEGQIVLVACARMIAMAVRNHGTVYWPPGVYIKIAGGAVQTFRPRDD